MPTPVEWADETDRLENIRIHRGCPHGRLGRCGSCDLLNEEAQAVWRRYHAEYRATHRLERQENRRRYRDQHAANQRNDPNRSARDAAALSRRAQRRLGREVEKVYWTVFQRIALLPCFSCGVEPAGAVDHIVSFSFGGRNVIENLQPSCLHCNFVKGGGERARVS